ncbi:MAG: formylglycine-generating enzyme family protein [Gemmataceae bacterium]
MRTRSFGILAAGLALLLCGADKKPSGDKDFILKLFASEFVPLTPGQGKFPPAFTMGSDGKDDPASEKPARQVKLMKPFAMAKYEVTQELYEAVTGKDPSKWKGPRNSVEMVTWDEANDFCKKLTQLLRERKLIAGDEVIRLPSEAEWEYACRAGTKTAYSFGDDASDLAAYAWFRGNSKGEDPPVGKKKPNPWGLYDMHGYIWEWCADSWHDTYKDAPTDGSAWNEKDAKERVIRSGSWAHQADQCRSAARMKAAASAKSDAIGFRCVKAKE